MKTRYDLWWFEWVQLMTNWLFAFHFSSSNFRKWKSMFKQWFCLDILRPLLIGFEPAEVGTPKQSDGVTQQLKPKTVAKRNRFEQKMFEYEKSDVRNNRGPHDSMHSIRIKQNKKKRKWMKIADFLRMKQVSLDKRIFFLVHLRINVKVDGRLHEN